MYESIDLHIQARDKSTTQTLRKRIFALQGWFYLALLCTGLESLGTALNCIFMSTSAVMSQSHMAI